MNMIGHPKHVPKCLERGADLICAQGGEGGGHTGDVPTTVLIPTVVEMCKNATSPFTGSRYKSSRPAVSSTDRAWQQR